ncbi:MAG: Na+/H+ antiporter subunit E [Planctomycetota bacterium]|nr:MAG: Na+/H+ antiporter subunit E [Planctomycetota bacterium]
MIFFLWNLLLALAWAFAVGVPSTGNLLLGFALGWGVLWLGRSILGSGDYTRRIAKIAEFAVFFAWKLLVANIRVARDVLTVKNYMQPAILAVPLDARTDAEIVLLANLISLTPGTLSLDVSHDRRFLYVHSMYTDDPEQAKLQLKQGFERRVLEVLR